MFMISVHIYDLIPSEKYWIMQNALAVHGTAQENHTKIQ